MCVIRPVFTFSAKAVSGRCSPAAAVCFYRDVYYRARPRDAGKSSSLFLHALYLFSQNSKSMVSFHMGINGMQKVSLPFTASLPSLCHLCIGCLALCVSPYCAILKLSVTKSNKSSPHPKATLKSKTNSDKRPCLF